MNEEKIKSALITMGSVGSCKKESWFFDRGITQSDLDAAVELGYLEKYEKDPNVLTSNAGYRLTREGRDFAWKRD